MVNGFGAAITLPLYAVRIAYPKNRCAMSIYVILIIPLIALPIFLVQLSALCSKTGSRLENPSVPSLLPYILSWPGHLVAIFMEAHWIVTSYFFLRISRYFAFAAGLFLITRNSVLA